MISCGLRGLSLAANGSFIKRTDSSAFENCHDTLPGFASDLLDIVDSTDTSVLLTHAQESAKSSHGQREELFARLHVFQQLLDHVILSLPPAHRPPHAATAFSMAPTLQLL